VDRVLPITHSIMARDMESIGKEWDFHCANECTIKRERYGGFESER